jgi:hypothetical protein
MGHPPYEVQEEKDLVVEYIVPELYESDNLVIATLLGADGSVLLEITQRRIVPFGYQRSD